MAAEGEAQGLADGQRKKVAGRTGAGHTPIRLDDSGYGSDDRIVASEQALEVRTRVLELLAYPLGRRISPRVATLPAVEPTERLTAAQRRRAGVSMTARCDGAGVAPRWALPIRVGGRRPFASFRRSGAMYGAWQPISAGDRH